MEHAASVARTFLTSDAVVVDIKEPEPVDAGNPMGNSGFYCLLGAELLLLTINPFKFFFKWLVNQFLYFL